MRLSYMKALCLSVSVYFTASLHAASLKKVLILDFKNVLKKSQYNYLEPSITNTIREKLKKRFVFQELEKQKWREMAVENYIAEEDLHTYSAAMTLGLLLKQDVVIFGGYVIEDAKKSDSPEITTRVRILDLAKRKEITNFETKNKIDSTYFTAINTIADRIVAEAKEILPNAEDWARSGAKDSLLNQFTLAGAAGIAVAPAAFKGALNSATTLNPADFPTTVKFHIGYERRQILSGFSAWGDFGYQIGSGDIPIEQSNLQVRASLSGFSLKAGLGFEFNVFRSLYFTPYAGGGYYLGAIKLSYSNLPIKPLNPVTGAEEDARTLDTSAPTMAGGAKLGLQISHSLGLEIVAEYLNLFYTGKMVGLFFLSGGLTFRI